MRDWGASPEIIITIEAMDKMDANSGCGMGRSWGPDGEEKLQGTQHSWSREEGLFGSVRAATPPPDTHTHTLTHTHAHTHTCSHTHTLRESRHPDTHTHTHTHTHTRFVHS